MNLEEREYVEVKRGCGNQSNSSSWSAAYLKDYDMYVALLSYSSACGCWEAIYEISAAAFERLGAFEDDDYKSERQIRKGRLLYRYENERNYPEPMEMIKDPCYEEYRRVLVNG